MSKGKRLGMHSRKTTSDGLRPKGRWEALSFEIAGGSIFRTVYDNKR